MKECWINVYEWSGDLQNPRRKIVASEQKFKNKIDSDYYIPSVGLYRVYRIHIKVGFEQRFNRWPNGYPLKMINGEVMTNVAKPNLKVFGVEVPGVKAGAGGLGIHEKWLEI